jgi:hypothetical protein
MATDAPSWLTSAFAEGVPELAAIDRPRPAPPYKGALGRCWLAQHDPRRRPCTGRLERFHFLRRGTVEDTIRACLLGVTFDPDDPFDLVPMADLAMLAGWDPRNADVACEGHHRRFDDHLGPALIVPVLALPIRAIDYVFDYGLETQAEDRFPGFNEYLTDDRDAP